jgi:hypothetical protein
MMASNINALVGSSTHQVEAPMIRKIILMLIVWLVVASTACETAMAFGCGGRLLHRRQVIVLVTSHQFKGDVKCTAGSPAQEIKGEKYFGGTSAHNSADSSQKDAAKRFCGNMDPYSNINRSCEEKTTVVVRRHCGLFGRCRRHCW